MVAAVLLLLQVPPAPQPADLVSVRAALEVADTARAVALLRDLVTRPRLSSEAVELASGGRYLPPGSRTEIAFMTAAVEPADRSDVRVILQGGVRMGIVTVLGVVAFALLSRVLTGTSETVVQTVLILLGGMAFSYLPSLGVRPRTVDGIAWATLVGLLGALAFTVVDTAVLRPVRLYHWSWDAIGGGSGFWYIPVWWMGSAVLAWLGGWTVASAARGGREPALPALAFLTGGVAVVLFGAGVVVGLLPFHAAGMALAFAVGLAVHALLAAATGQR